MALTLVVVILCINQLKEVIAQPTVDLTGVSTSHDLLERIWNEHQSIVASLLTLKQENEIMRSEIQRNHGLIGDLREDIAELLSHMDLVAITEINRTAQENALAIRNLQAMDQSLQSEISRLDDILVDNYIAFYATSPLRPFYGTPVYFPEISLNDGGAFDGHHFICPHDGVYMLQAQLAGYAPQNVMTLQIYKNRDVIVRASENVNDTFTLNTMVVTHCLIGDQVYVGTDNFPSLGSMDNFFAGFLLYKY